MTPRTLRFPFSGPLAAAVLLLASGCAGYRLGEVKPAAFREIEKIHVPTFENDTLEPRLAVLLTNAVISQLHQDGTYQITSEEEADAILVGRISQLRRFQQRSTQREVLQSRELVEVLEVDFRLKDATTGQTLSQINPFGIDANDRDSVTGQRTQSGRASGQSSVFLDQNLELSERQALALAAQDAARQIVSQLTEGW
jgi:hypothetical protein